MTNYAHGHHAETVAARYLQNLGYKIYALNWKHRRAEIDIVAGSPESGEPVFVEVKYRVNLHQGSGLDYITPRKLQQMYFAARLWTAQRGYGGGYRLAAIEVAGPAYDVAMFVPDIA